MAAEIAGETTCAITCAKCGACAAVCPVYRADRREALTARGRMHLLNSELSEHPTGIFADIFSRCLLCGACEQVCPRHLPITDLISQARSTFSPLYGPNGLKKAVACTALSHPGLLEGLVKAGINLRRLTALPSSSGLRLKLGLLEERTAPSSEQHQERLQEEDPVSPFSYFTGCFARHIQPSVSEATQSLLRSSGLPTAYVPPEQHCCGLAAWSAGKREQARELARKNIRAFAGISGPIITSCASCSSHLLAYPELFAKNDPWHNRASAFAERVLEFTSFFADALPCSERSDGTGKRVFYHDPCHLRFQDNGANGMKAPRALLGKAGVSILEPEDGPLCCGQGGLFHIACPELSAQIFQKSSKQALAASPDYITTTCSGCLMQFQEGMAGQGRNVKVVHPAVLLAEYPDGLSDKHS